MSDRPQSIPPQMVAAETRAAAHQPELALHRVGEVVHRWVGRRRQAVPLGMEQSSRTADSLPTPGTATARTAPPPSSSRGPTPRYSSVAFNTPSKLRSTPSPTRVSQLGRSSSPGSRPAGRRTWLELRAARSAFPGRGGRVAVAVSLGVGYLGASGENRASGSSWHGASRRRTRRQHLDAIAPVNRPGFFLGSSIAFPRITVVSRWCW